MKTAGKKIINNLLGDILVKTCDSYIHPFPAKKFYETENLIKIDFPFPCPRSSF